MNRLLKYLFFLILIVVVSNTTVRDEDALSQETFVGNSQVEEESDYITFASLDQLFSTTLPVSSSATARLQGGVKRPNNNVHKHNYTFLKAEKIIKTGIKYFIQNSTIIIHSALAEPAHRLIVLCKLII